MELHVRVYLNMVVKTNHEASAMTNRKELHDANIEGHWWKIKSILKNSKGATKLVISDNGNTLLHLAVRKGKNNFMKELLNFIGNEETESKNFEGHTTLHIAAIVGNKDAAKLLVEKRKELLEAMNDKGFCLGEYYKVDHKFCEKLLPTSMSSFEQWSFENGQEKFVTVSFIGMYAHKSRRHLMGNEKVPKQLLQLIVDLTTVIMKPMCKS
ncbi:Ankyrin repeat-containing protein [Artemisia annua]|uniref:Ankyrin repeat-containing protein n=1 Tax=Artemisia annua TaxID=35608 RepID=A0A2U1NT55_ARTAN|nr:Ankyrin repeat-containing protein [Artemisia annua]